MEDRSPVRNGPPRIAELFRRITLGVYVVAQRIGGRILDTDAAPLTYAETGTMERSGSLYPASF